MMSSANWNAIPIFSPYEVSVSTSSFVHCFVSLNLLVSSSTFDVSFFSIESPLPFLIKLRALSAAPDVSGLTSVTSLTLFFS